jgi:hypothetical protein
MSHGGHAPHGAPSARTTRAYASGNIAMMYHLKKETPKTKPVVFRQPTTIYLTANKRPSVILKNSDDTRPVPVVAKPS